MGREERQPLPVRAIYIGGPTALIDVAGARLLTDPTFDEGGSEFTTPVYTLRKHTGPAVDAPALGRVDAVLLSHDHHFDNLDRAGRAMLATASQVLTTTAGAERLGGNAIGLTPWDGVDLHAPSGQPLRVTATPARHGPADGDRGPVIGFLITESDGAQSPVMPAVYVSGDTVWYDALRELGARADIRVAFLFMGAARVKEVGPAHLTMTAAEGVMFAKTFTNAVIVPLHYAGWEHFSEGRTEIQRAFDDAGLGTRVRWLEPGRETTL